MKTLNKLIIKDLKLNKKRTIVTIVGVILSTALICAVVGVFTSFQATFTENARKTDGNYHMAFVNVPKDELKYIENNRNVESYFLSEGLGYSKLEGSKNEYKPYLYVQAFDKDSMESLNVVKGRLPKTSDEVVISQTIKSDAGIEYKIGDTITLNLGKRMSEGEELNQNSVFHKEDETFVFENTKTYKVVGIISRPNRGIESFNAPGYTVVTALDKPEKQATISVLYKNPKNYEKITNEINGIKNEGDVGKYSTYSNGDLLRWEGGAFSDTSLTTIYMLAAIVILIIVVSSVLVIKNSFNISVTERFKQYGMLSSVGATSKQIKKSVLFEGVILGIIGIPLGIILGVVAIAILLFIINIILGDYLNGMEFVYKVPLIAVFLSVLVSGLTIYLSTIFSARKAAKISPIEAIRSNNDIKIKAKKIKAPKFIKKLFKIGGEIAYKNLKRNKKKYRTTIISLVVSIVIFISLSSVLTYGFKVSSFYYKDMYHNIAVYIDRNSQDSGSYEDYLKLSKLDNVDEFSINRYARMDISPKYFSDFGKELNMGTAEASIEIISVSDEEYLRFAKRIGKNPDMLKDGAILIDNVDTYINDKKITGNVYNLNVGDSISGKNEDKEFTIKISAKTDERPMGLEGYSSSNGYLIVSDEYIKQFPEQGVTAIFIQSDKSDELVDNLSNLAKDDSSLENMSINNLDKSAKEQNAVILVISIFLYGFISVITLIGVTNIFNTITTSMNLRSKEFAMLKSVGMSSKEFNHMIRLESLFYGLKSLIIGIPIGLGLAYLIYMGIGESMIVDFVFPFKEILIAIIFVFVIVSITMRYSLNKVNKQNIIETIRNDNI